MLVRNLSFAAIPLLLSACATASNSATDAQLEHKAAHNTVVNEQKPVEQNSTTQPTKAKQSQSENSDTEQEALARKAQFERNLKQTKPVGTQVCTWQNSVGYVAEEAQNRMKIHVQGRALSTTYWAFFGAVPPHEEIEQQEAEVWTDGSDWAVCHYK